MKLAGVPERIELHPETDEEKEHLSRIVQGNAVVFWGDSEDIDKKGTVFVMNSARVCCSQDDTGLTSQSDPTLSF
ncbi:hypothetical protein LCGC14_0310670 [marine sediment metagenome]|uniref:Uncharacterized protein n=1 Tax=marine sediment metagenome TaxID=412755 RepID=A0A0F9TSC8_9ZZZZ